jgi:ATP-dependent Zn protease
MPLGRAKGLIEIFMDEEQLEETAYHESGHAFAAANFGGRVRSLSIRPDRDDGPERFGDVTVVWPQGQMSPREFQNKLVLVALSGPVAEMIYRGEPLHPGFVAEWADDWRSAWAAAEPLIPDERQRLALLEEAARELHKFLSRDDSWAAIAALADNLLAYEVLESEQIHEILSAWMQ